MDKKPIELLADMVLGLVSSIGLLWFSETTFQKTLSVVGILVFVSLIVAIVKYQETPKNG